MNTLLQWAIGIPLALFIANGGEWIIHKRILHKRGKLKGNFWNFHWYEHHNESRRNGMPDPAYESASLLQWNARTKELASLSTGIFFWVPMLIFGSPFAQAFAVGAMYSTVNYYYVHRKSHLNPEWARKHLAWHVDHHLGPDQDKNWCVTKPWWDWIMGTREKYVGTEREAADLARKAERAARRGVRTATPADEERAERASPSPARP